MWANQVIDAPPDRRAANMTAEPARIDYASVFPTGVRAMVGLQHAVDAAGLEPLLLELVKMRASQINGCAYCLDMHSKDARALGESEQRLHLLAAWREAPCYDSRERAALAWCEDLTLISKQGAPDTVYEKLEQTFSPEEIVALTLAIVAINGWNRLAISMRAPVGAYVSPHRPPSDPSAASQRVGVAKHTHNHEGESCP
jgi:AhpD family alkylhydroperoxidase